MGGVCDTTAAKEITHAAGYNLSELTNRDLGSTGNSSYG